MQFTGTDWSTSEKNNIRDGILANYPGTTFLGDATKTYNCHNYAWHMASGGTYVYWMNQYKADYSPNIHNYWADGSYIEICNELATARVFYYSGDHSAVIPSAVSGVYDSKWGETILVRHSPTNVPPGYIGSNRKYYASTGISGSTSLLCSGTRTLSVVDIPGATYTWSVSTHLLSIVSGQGTNQITVQRNGSLFGQGWAEVEISTPCSSGSAKSARFQFQVGGIKYTTFRLRCAPGEPILRMAALPLMVFTIGMFLAERSYLAKEQPPSNLLWTTSFHLIPLPRLASRLL